MSNVSTGMKHMADVESAVNDQSLGELIIRAVHFPRAGEEVVVVLPDDYSVPEVAPNGNYRARV